MLVTIVFLLLMISKGIECGPRSKQVTELRETLFSDYDREVRPNDTTIVKLSSISLQDIRYDDQANIMDLYTWTGLTWTDDRLSWNSTDYEEVGASIRISANKIWLPDITVYNHATPDYIWKAAEVLVVVTNKGEITYIVPVDYKVICIGDLTLWPYDEQNCKVKLGAWTHSGLEIDLQLTATLDKSDLSTRLLEEGTQIYSSEWGIKQSDIKRNIIYYACCPEPYIDVLITLTISRIAPAYVVTVQVPTICLIVLTLVIFLLPPTSEEKMTFGGICLILNAIFMGYTSNLIGNHSPMTTPLILQLLSIQMQYLVLTVIISAIVVRIGSKPHPYQFSLCISRALRMMSCSLCLPHYRQMEPEDNVAIRAPNYTESSSPVPITSSSSTAAVYPVLRECVNYPKNEPQPSQPSPYISGSNHPVNLSPPEYFPLPTAPKVEVVPILAAPEQAPSSDKIKNYSSDWLLLAATIDRIAFFLYLILCSITYYQYSSALM